MRCESEGSSFTTLKFHNGGSRRRYGQSSKFDGGRVIRDPRVPIWGFVSGLVFLQLKRIHKDLVATGICARVGLGQSISLESDE